MNTLYSNKKLAKLLLPLVIEQLLIVLVGMADVLMVATLGEAAVSGVSLVDAVNNLILQVLFALTAGGTVICAQFVGRKDERGAGKVGGQLFFITVSSMLLISLILFLGNRPILSLIFGQVEAAVMDNAVIYMALTAMSFPFLAVYHSSAAVFRAMGNTKISMLMSLLMNVINVSGNAICIFGLKMGVMGVGIPTLISRIIAALAILTLLQKKDNAMRIRNLSDLLPQSALIRQILSIGIPNSVESGIFQFGKLILQSLVSTLGTPSIAAFAVASNLVTYLYLPGNALGAGMLTIIGQCYGAGEMGQARHYAKKLVLINYAMLAVLSSVLIFGRSFFVGCYQLTGISADLARDLVFSHAVAMIIWPLGFLLPYYFRAIGRAAFTMVVAIVTMWLFRVGLAWVFIRLLHFNVLGIWYAMYVDWIFRMIIYVIAFWRSGGPLISGKNTRLPRPQPPRG
ncbi:MAG: MATE family efflux transporter [Eubacterium sp.]|nr:MATE family efflux transporter [Eubacterium sp.]